MLDIAGNALGHLMTFQEPSQNMEDDHEVVDIETYLKETEIDRNWQIPRKKLEITGEQLGRGEFSIVYKGFYLKQGNRKLPVAVKTLSG